MAARRQTAHPTPAEPADIAHTHNNIHLVPVMSHPTGNGGKKNYMLFNIQGSLDLCFISYLCNFNRTQPRQWAVTVQQEI